MSDAASPLDRLDGVLVVDKPAGMTSAHVVARVKRVLRADRVGHTGTLDPMATGVLPIVLGEATKLAGYLLADDKVYDGELELGFETDTLDVEGQVLRRSPVPELSLGEIEEALARLTGEIDQIPPMYSALKHEGKRLHELARSEDADVIVIGACRKKHALRGGDGCRIARGAPCPVAVAPLTHSGGGIPRRINRLCSRLLLFGVLEEVHEITESMVDTTAEELQQDLEGGASELSDLPVPPAHRANGGSNGAAISDVLHRIEVLEQQMASREQVFRRLTSLLGVR